MVIEGACGNWSGGLQWGQRSLRQPPTILVAPEHYSAMGVIYSRGGTQINIESFVEMWNPQEAQPNTARNPSDMVQILNSVK